MEPIILYTANGSIWTGDTKHPIILPQNTLDTRVSNILIVNKAALVGTVEEELKFTGKDPITGKGSRKPVSNEEIEAATYENILLKRYNNRKDKDRTMTFHTAQVMAWYTPNWF